MADEKRKDPVAGGEEVPSTRGSEGGGGTASGAAGADATPKDAPHGERGGVGGIGVGAGETKRPSLATDVGGLDENYRKGPVVERREREREK